MVHSVEWFVKYTLTYMPALPSASTFIMHMHTVPYMHTSLSAFPSQSKHILN